MKHLIVFLILISGFTLQNCYKDAINEDKIEKKVIVLDPDKFDVKSFLSSIQGRDGGQNPFNFPESGVTYNPFTAKHTQTAANLSLVDSVSYFRISEVDAFAWDTYWDVYNITYFFKNNTTLVLSRTYAPAYLGQTSTIYPNIAHNQLYSSNPNTYVTIDRTTKREKYVDVYCGKNDKIRLFYVYTVPGLINTAPAIVDTVPINGKICNSSVFNFAFII